MARTIGTQPVSESRELIINSTLKNTYILLALTLAFSAAMAGLSMMMNWPPMGIIMFFGGFFGLSFLTTKFQDSSWGILCVFALTGFLGAYMGPMINYYISSLGNGSQIVMTAMGGTAIIFTALSAYVVVTRKDFSFMAGMLMTGILVAFLAGLASIFFNMPALSLAVSAMFMMLSSGLIMYKTSEIIHGGETNYISATVTLFVSIFNIFSSLLHILGIFGDE